ncbi:MAG TPA: UDP-N-acetylmuramoyl-tripeptide--D-alanyl-D-alanine ligase [Verrucomicrobiae bacterium]|jgi:UDP-N-acetylmuramoyl-tripeptide--D-alanyl-D-alanine ligase|nr:UDP-N-acetylmuramoyl-tripeptide--D-alanyl-D-alanine ligase [Verrucomicrobiae bacterium]
MEERSLKFIAEACGAKIVAGAPDTLVKNVGIDSRRAKAGDVFFAIKGENFDGHAFVNEVADKKVTAVVIEQKKAPSQLPGCAVLEVPDTIAALGKFAAAYRRDFTLPVVCVCGSNGKTTTKELTASVLRQKFTTLWSEASFNNNIGVPLTLLRMDGTHRAAVLEAGTNHPGELAPLLEMIRPNMGVLTNIGREHLEFFGDLAGVAREEGRLAEQLPPDGTLFINGDNSWTSEVIKRTRARVVRVGLGEKNDWRAEKTRLDKGGVTFMAAAPKKELCGEYRVPLLGRYQALNALFAMAFGAEVGMTAAEIQRGLVDCKPAKMRMQFWEAGGIRVLDDAYNANADSMVAALETLRDLPLQGRRVAVLGDMAELGACSEAAHAEVGRRAAELQVGQLFAVGKMAPIMAKAARDAGLSRVIEFENVEAATKAVKSFLKSGDLVLLKASRSSHLERIAETLKMEK